jgi:hypothetical protein
MSAELVHQECDERIRAGGLMINQPLARRGTGKNRRDCTVTDAIEWLQGCRDCRDFPPNFVRHGMVNKPGGMRQWWNVGE